MTEEEKKAIDKINREITIGKCEKAIGIPVYISDLETVLNLIETQQKEIEELKEDNNHQWEERCRLTFESEKMEKEIEKKDKVIDEMADNLYIKDEFSEFGNSRDEIKQYFYGKVANNG